MTNETSIRPALKCVYFMYKVLLLIREDLLYTFTVIWLCMFSTVSLFIVSDVSYRGILLLISFFICGVVLIIMWDERELKSLKGNILHFFPLIPVLRYDILNSSLPSGSYLIWSWINRFFFRSGFFSSHVAAFTFLLIIWYLAVSLPVLAVYFMLYLYGIYVSLTIAICWEVSHDVGLGHSAWEDETRYHIIHLEKARSDAETAHRLDPRPYVLKDVPILLKRKKRKD